MTTNRLPNQADEQHGDEKALHPLLFNPGYEDVNISSTHMSCELSPKDYGFFARTSIAGEAATAFIRLLSSTVGAEPESYKQADETRLAGIVILKRHPELLFRKGTVTDHFDRKIWGSPYQLFLGAGDIWALKQVHEAILPNIPDGEAQAKVHFQAQFPHCQWPLDPQMDEEALYDDRNKAQIKEVIAQLNIIVVKITADPCTNGIATLDETTNAVIELCQMFAPKEGEVIRTGLHFPLAMMNEIFKVYNAQFDPWSGEQLAFFSRAVIGAVLAASTAVDGQCCKHGLRNLDMEKGPDRRDGLFCLHPQGIPKKLSPLIGKLGQSMFVDPFDGYSCFLTATAGSFSWYNKNGGSGAGWAMRAVTYGCAALETYVEQKRQTWRTYAASPEESVLAVRNVLG